MKDKWRHIEIQILHFITGLTYLLAFTMMEIGYILEDWENDIREWIERKKK